MKTTDASSALSPLAISATWMLAIALLLVAAVPKPIARADQASFMEIGMQLTGLNFTHDTNATTGWVTVSAANGTLRVSVDLDGAPINYGDSGTVPLRMEVNRPYPYTASQHRLYSGGVRFEIPACSDTYELIIYDEEGKKAATIDHENDYGILPYSPSTAFVGTIVLTNSLQVWIDSPCACDVETEGPQLIADGLSRAYAWVPGKMGLSWSIKEPARGAQIDGLRRDSQNNVLGAYIRAGEENGPITIRAMEGSCVYEGILELTCAETSGGGCSHGSCGTFGGATVSHDNGPDIQLGLGQDSFHYSGGTIVLRQIAPSTNLTSPRLLQPIHTGPTTRVIWNGDGSLRQVRSPLGMVDITWQIENIVDDVLLEYDLAFYVDTDVEPELVNGLYAPKSQANPMVVWRVGNPDLSGLSANHLWITEIRGGQTNLVHKFHFDDSLGGWSLSDDRTDRVLWTWEEPVQGTSQTNRFLEIWNDQILRYKEQRLYDQLPNYDNTATNRTLTKLIVGSGTDTNITQYTYYHASAPATNRYRLKQIDHPDGRWEIFTYDADGRVARHYTPHGDTAPTTTEANCRVTEYTYVLGAGEGDDNGAWQPHLPRKTISKILGQEVARTYRKITEAETIEKVCAIPGASWSDSNNIVTITKRMTGSEHYGRLLEIAHPDGTKTLYDYSDSGGTFTTTVDRGAPSGGAIKEGTRSITVVGPVGELLSRTTRVLSNSLPSVVLSDETYTYTDDLKRSYRAVHLNGRTNTVEYACCDWIARPIGMAP
jgi:hypothetical protein